MRGSHLMSLTTLLFATATASQQDVIDDVLGRLEKATFFFENQFGQINLDGVVGYIILQAELKESVRIWPEADLASQLSTAVNLTQRLDHSLAQAVDALQKTDPKYFREFEPLLEASFWTVPHEWDTSDPTLAYTAFRMMECYDEQLSDKCISLLLGTWKDNGTPCIVTKACRDTMTRFGCPHYSLSHQLLYFMVGKMRGCSNILEGERRQSRANMTDRDYQKMFCSNMMKSNAEFVRKGFPGQTRDIFIENIMLCGLAGFSDFYKSDWLQNILLWQDLGVGCFGKDEKDIAQLFGEDEVENKQVHKRVKRREKTLCDGCSSHMTGVAVSALGGYLNYYLTEQDITKRPLT
ncbi:hypothetical protein COCON_G00028780 [Conger conger]|uniref:Secreted protein n=1 Tax=Conger conger TaxID=82655 RepID=A0A9Q1DYC5_CONCO|nr:UPF0764 protein C16orf89 homolog [Conger conger]KAJ8284028.1 hypothetical protein COCON_G00028780 [Conger conger]